MSDIVWSINPKNDNFKLVLEKMKHFGESICSSSEISFSFLSEAGIDKLLLDIEQRKNLFLIYKEAVNNAIKYSGEHTLIEFSTEINEDRYMFSVKDNGIGIPPEYKGKVFEKFFRVPSGDTHNAKGHGLGLSYSAEVVRRHKGSISVESTEGSGSTFTVILPKQNT
jgi:signal transduction histidine kinase